jgi:hypothetical protein
MKMTNRNQVNGAVTNPTADSKNDSTHHLKSIFDQSLAVLCQGSRGESSGESKESARNKKQLGQLRMGSLPIHMDAVNLQKRALSNAAEALTALWKIPVRGRLQSREQYSRSTL